MPHSNFPIGSDLITWLQGSAMLPAVLTAAQNNLDYDGAMLSAIERWQNDTGYRPWLTTTQTRVFDPPGSQRGALGNFLATPGIGLGRVGGSNKLFLRTGLLSVTTLTVGKSGANPGTVLVQGTDFWLNPTSAPQINAPYSSILFRFPQWGEPQSIEIVGDWGFSDMIDDSVWNAVRDAGAEEVIPSLENLATGNYITKKEGDVATEYMTRTGVGIFDGDLKACELRYQATLNRPPYRMRGFR